MGIVEVPGTDFSTGDEDEKSKQESDYEAGEEQPLEVIRDDAQSIELQRKSAITIYRFMKAWIMKCSYISKKECTACRIVFETTTDWKGHFAERDHRIGVVKKESTKQQQVKQLKSIEDTLQQCNSDVKRWMQKGHKMTSIKSELSDVYKEKDFLFETRSDDIGLGLTEIEKKLMNIESKIAEMNDSLDKCNEEKELDQQLIPREDPMDSDTEEELHLETPIKKGKIKQKKKKKHPKKRNNKN